MENVQKSVPHLIFEIDYQTVSQGVAHFSEHSRIMGQAKQMGTCTLNYGQPDEKFWENYNLLWRNSAERSPFQSPRILRYFSMQEGADIAVFQYRDTANELIGAAIFQKSKSGFHFLSDLKTDANFFVLHRDCSAALTAHFFQSFFQKITAENWALQLNNQPNWATYMPYLEAAGENSGLYWLKLPYSVCPIVEAETPEALYKQVNGSRELRYRMNKLKNQKNAEFEVLTDDAGIDHWVDEFSQAHILRWADTPTPSGYRSVQKQAFLKGCLHAWAQEGILVRFSVVVEGSRVGFVVGLREGGSLIHHSTTFHPDFWKFSPGKALILFMTEWMQDNNLKVLDFGDGNEPYKYSVATSEHVLSRIFVASRSNLPFILKTRAIKFIRNNSGIYNFYSNKIKPKMKQLLG